MQRSTVHANQVTPSYTGKWCVLVQVIERRKPKKKPNGPLYMNHVVTDTQVPFFFLRNYLLSLCLHVLLLYRCLLYGTKVPIMVYDKQVDFFAHTLHPYKHYYVSNTIVKETPPNYRSLQYPYTWTLHRKNLVEPYPEAIPPPLPCTFPYDRFSDLYRHADQDRSVCIKALLVQTLPLQENEGSSSYRDCVVVNEEKIPMILRVWDDVQFDTDVNVYARYKVPALIIAYGLKVITHHGLSLRTKTSAYIMENPPLTDDLSLKDWYTSHSTEITILVENRAYRNPTYLFHPPHTAEIHPLSFAVSAIENVKTILTEGTLTYLPGQERLWFEACEKCRTELDVDSDWKIMCSYCKEYTNVTVCYDISVFLNHGPTTVEATIRSPEAEKLLPFTANELRLAAAENKPLTKQVEAALEKKHVICFLRYYDRDNRGIGLHCYPLVKIYTEAEVHEYERIQQTAALAEALAENTAPTEHIGSSSSTLASMPDKQLFTPTIEVVLEQIGGLPAPGSPQLHAEVGAKRTLTFDEPETVQPVDPPTQQDPHTMPPPSTSASTEQQSTNPAEATPQRKLRAKRTSPKTCHSQHSMGKDFGYVYK